MNQKPREPSAAFAHIDALDGLRGIAVSAVVVLHYFVSINSAELGSLKAWILRLLEPLWVGVDLFFVLSGFLVGRIVFQCCDAENFKRIFYLRRAARIVPLYYICIGIWLLAHLVLQPLGSDSPARFALGDLSMLPYFLSFTQNLVAPFLEGNFLNLGFALAPTWSVCIEEHFYWLAPLVLPWMPKQRRVQYLLLLWLMFFGLRGCAVASGFSEYWVHYMLSPLHADGIFAGLLLAALSINHAPVSSSVPLSTLGKHRAAPVIYIGAFTVVWCYLVLHDKNSASARLVDFLAVAALFFILVQAVIRNWWPRLTALLSASSLRWLGQRSYAIYLFHNGLLALCFGMLGMKPNLQQPSYYLLSVAALVLTLILSEVSFRWIEMPILIRARSKPFVFASRS
jgi:peptidoglycan/LPS O-acetylase OafA/YrhL